MDSESLARSMGASPHSRPRMVPVHSKKPPVNKPCPCGSGKKYKRCCMRPKPAPIPKPAPGMTGLTGITR